VTEDDLDRLAAAIAPALRRHVPEPARHSDERRDVNVEKSGVWLDYKSLLGMSIALSLVGWWASGYLMQVQYDMREVRTLLINIPKQMEASIEAVRDALSERIERLETDRASQDPDRYGRAAHDIWCLETERLNRDIGWDCAPLPGRPRPPHLMQPQDYYYQPWTTETKKDRAKP
jgi:hypothetical protein